MNVVDTLFKDKHGRVVLFQTPNAIAWVAIIATILSWILPYGTLNFVAALISFGAIFTWGWQELFDGVTLFRRAIGCAVLILLILSKIT
ncbi:hypothetical protein E6P97_00730 [Patescibacteria group bacterium]|nr:MAG: hypothetical protein E6P97_00730 [Patescibacteria group bacterium]